MKTQKEIHALIIEKDDVVSASIQKILEDRSYGVTRASDTENAHRLLKDKNIALAVAGEIGTPDSSFHVMKEIVMTSPMTAIILITDLPEEEVDEKAEGYGILGHAGRTVALKDLAPLLDTFEMILGLS